MNPVLRRFESQVLEPHRLDLLDMRKIVAVDDDPHEHDFLLFIQIMPESPIMERQPYQAYDIIIAKANVTEFHQDCPEHHDCWGVGALGELVSLCRYPAWDKEAAKRAWVDALSRMARMRPEWRLEG